MKRTVLHWRLKRLMAKRNIAANTVLQAELAKRGCRLSSAHVGRLVDRTPSRLSLNLLHALCDVLACAPGDLLELEILSTGAADHHALRPHLTADERRAVVGPKMRALAAHLLASKPDKKTP